VPLDLNQLLAEQGAIARRLSRFELRPQQLEMASAIERTLSNRGKLVVEAGTGVGKSFAYLLPAIGRVVNSSERVVISTHTINLQEQLIDKDIPLLNAVIPEEFSAVLVKGRGNYVSVRRLKQASERQDRLLSDDEQRHSLHVIEDWAYSTKDGTLATLPPLSRPAVWDHVQSDAHNCMGRKCPTYDICFYQAARRRMEHGDILVCNHALFFADLALRARGVGFLPPYDHVILDEAHLAEDVAAEHFGVSLSIAQVMHLLNLLYQPRSGRGFLPTFQLTGLETQPIDQAIQQTLRCRDAAESLFAALEIWQATSGSANGRIAKPDIVPNELTACMKDLASQLKLLRERAKTEPDQFELNSYAMRANEIAASAAVLIEQQIDGCVYWLEATSGGESDAFASQRRHKRVALKCMPVEVGPILRERLFEQDFSVVMTSATLATTAGNFEHFLDRTGFQGAETQQLGSPFAFDRQMRVFVDRSMPDPNDKRFIDALCVRIREQIAATDGGAFVLFTSFAMLRTVAERLRSEFSAGGHPVLVQGSDGPPGLLLRRFRDAPRAVLFGTASFWQGVDVRGQALRNVIITRLPFEVPDRPLVQARHDRITERGGEPFRDDQLPKAVLRFRQGIGRLIRSHEDRGRVVVLDPRIVRKAYGRMFLAALPEGVPVEDLSERIDLD
jgi:ATP-dependent DNA helicase DinG